MTQKLLLLRRETEDRRDPTRSIADSEITNDKVAESTRRESVTRETHTPPPLRRVRNVTHPVRHKLTLPSFDGSLMSILNR